MTGLLLAGIGDIDSHQNKNFVIVDGSECGYWVVACVGWLNVDCSATPTASIIVSPAVWNTSLTMAETQTSAIEAAFQEFTEDRKDIAILLINQHVCAELWVGANIADR